MPRLAGAEARPKVVALTACVSEDQVLIVGRVVGEYQTERAGVAREGFGERGAPRENAHAALRPRRRRSCRCRTGRKLQPQMKRRTDLRPALDTDAAAHQLGEFAADGEPEPAAAEAAGGRLVRLGEGLEDLADRGRVHADSRVAHRDLEARAPWCGGMDVRLDDHLALGGEL